MSEHNNRQLLDEISYLKAELKRAKETDTLTGLYNRNTFIERTRCRFENFPDKNYMIVCLDVEKFKFINDRFGFVEGDRLLAHIGKRLIERAERYRLVAARLSSDIFAFLDEEKNLNPEAFGAEVQEWVKDYPLGTDIKIAVGVYHVDAKNIPVRLMCDRASFATETVKGNYMINVAEYNKTMRDYVFSQHELLNDTESAFENREFKVYLQPKYDIRTNKIIGAESLVRWQHPVRGLIFPKDFIPLFEQNMIITRLDEYIWEETCRLIRGWIDKGYAAVPVSVNVSRLDIHSLDVPERFVAFTDKYELDRKFIEIEITESAFTNDENRIIEVVDELRSLGFRVLMDDFGSGYSSLNILKDINVDVLKIDTRFLEPGRSDNNRGKEILESVIRMAKWIGLQTIAEGVETDEQKKFLMDLGCYYAQGFYFSKPIAEDSFAELIEDSDNVISESAMSEMEHTIAIEELFHSDYMTENLLNNILGGVALYSYKGGNDLSLVKANEYYYRITNNYAAVIEDSSFNPLDTVYEDDRSKIIDALEQSKNNGSEGVVVQIRSIRDAFRWLTLKIFFLADREESSMYYASVVDSTEQMLILNELDMSKLSLETALELIDAVVIEYNFDNKRLVAKSKRRLGRDYLFGEEIENAVETLTDKHVVHPSSLIAFEAMCEHLKASEEPVCDMINLLYIGNVYKKCEVTAKSVFVNGKPFNVTAVIKSTGEIIN